MYVFFVFLTDTCTGTACTRLAFNTFSDRFSEVLRQICTEKVKTQKVSETQDPVGSISPRAHSQGSRFVLFFSPRPGVLVSSTSPRAYIQHARFGRIFFHATSRTPRRACDLMMLDAVRPKTSAESTNCVLSLRPGDGRESFL